MNLLNCGSEYTKFSFMLTADEIRNDDDSRS